MIIGSNQRVHALSNNQINIEIDGKSNKRVNEAKSLGLLIDEHLSWTKHIGENSKTISSAIGALKRIHKTIHFRKLHSPNLPSINFTPL